jgi:hypothetical protein
MIGKPARPRHASRWCHTRQSIVRNAIARDGNRMLFNSYAFGPFQAHVYLIQ